MQTCVLVNTGVVRGGGVVVMVEDMDDDEYPVVPPMPSYLHSGLRQADPECQLFSHEDVWVVGLGEAPL